MTLKKTTHALATTTATNPAPCAPAEPTPEQWRSLYTETQARLQPDLDALDRTRLLTVNVDIATAVTTALSVVPVLELMRAEVAALNVIDMSAYDRVGDYARLLSYAHGGYLATINAPDPLPALHTDAVTLRDELLVGCDGLRVKKLLDAGFIKELREGQGYQDTAMDLLAIARAVRAIWAKAQGKSSIELGELLTAEDYADKILAALALREKRAETLTKQASERQLAFTLMVRAYDEVRRVMTFVRWHHDDVDTLVPSLYAKAGATRHKEKSVEIPTPIDASKPAQPTQPTDTKPARALPLNQ